MNFFNYNIHLYKKHLIALLILSSVFAILNTAAFQISVWNVGVHMARILRFILSFIFIASLIFIMSRKQPFNFLETINVGRMYAFSIMLCVPFAIAFTFFGLHAYVLLAVLISYQNLYAGFIHMCKKVDLKKAKEISKTMLKGQRDTLVSIGIVVVVAYAINYLAIEFIYSVIYDGEFGSLRHILANFTSSFLYFFILLAAPIQLLYANYEFNITEYDLEDRDIKSMGKQFYMF